MTIKIGSNPLHATIEAFQKAVQMANAKIAENVNCVWFEMDRDEAHNLFSDIMYDQNEVGNFALSFRIERLTISSLTFHFVAKS